VFFSQQQAVIYVAACCQRVYLGLHPAQGCRTCSNLPHNHEVRTPQQLLGVVQELVA
jgi:hypothetical protein